MKHKKRNSNRIALTSDAYLEDDEQLGASAESNESIFSSEDEYDIDRELAREFNEPPTEKKAKKKLDLSAFLSMRSIIGSALAVVCVVCVVILVGRMFSYNRTDRLYQALAEDMFREPTGEASVLSHSPSQSLVHTLNNYDTTLTLGKSEGETSENTAVVDIAYARIRAKLEQIKAINDDIIGWIKIDGTSVNYPVVLGEDNEYYLTHAYNGEYLRSGTIMADYQCFSSAFDNKNLVLYGHNMANGSMFATVQKYFRDPDMLHETTIYFYGFDGVYVYEPIMLLDTDTAFYYYQIHFFGRGEYENFLSAMYNAANYKKDVTLTSDDKLITFSTCTNRKVTGRYVLMARLVRVDNSTGRQS